MYEIFYYEPWDVYVNYKTADGHIVDVAFSQEEADLLTRMYNTAEYLIG